MREATKKATETITVQAINDLIDVANLIARESVEEYMLLVTNVLNAPSAETHTTNQSNAKDVVSTVPKRTS